MAIAKETRDMLVGMAAVGALIYSILRLTGCVGGGEAATYVGQPGSQSIWKADRIYLYDDQFWLSSGGDAVIAQIFENGRRQNPSSYIRINGQWVQRMPFISPIAHGEQSMEMGITLRAMQETGEGVYTDCVRTEGDNKRPLTGQDRVLVISLGKVCFTKDRSKVLIQLGQLQGVVNDGIASCIGVIRELNACVIEDRREDPRTQAFELSSEKAEVN